MPQTPIIYFAFADQEDRPLEKLKEEHKLLTRSLLPLRNNGYLETRGELHSNFDDVIQELPSYINRLAIFHFAGHGLTDGLQLEDKSISTKGFSGLLSQNKELKLVFLNACSTFKQADEYIEKGVKAVLAITAPIGDEAAMTFSKYFYQNLAEHCSIREAFSLATNAVLSDPEFNSIKASDEAIIVRGLVGFNEKSNEDFLWKLYVREDSQEVLDWRIEKIKAKEEGSYPHLLTKLPSLEDTIIGRETEIETLRQTLESDQRVVLMNGMGGIGKTTTAIAYANKFKEEYVHIAWIEQLTDFVSDLTTNKLLTQNLVFTPTDDPVSDAQLILNKLSNLGGKSLLIIDNANHQINQFKDFLPKAPGWHVLITSREELSFARILPLDFLSKDNALRLFYSHYGRNKDDKTLNEILETVDYHTLTIELLAKTAQKRRIQPLSSLKTLLHEKGVKIGRKVDFSIAHSGTEKVAMLFPYLKAIFQINEEITEEEIKLLKQFIGLPPIFIPYDTLIQLFQIDQEDENSLDQLTGSLDRLKERGWLTFDIAQDGYKMHRIIQEVLKEHLNPSYEDLESLVKSVSSALYIDQAKDNPIDKFLWVPYGEQLLNIFGNREEESFARFQTNLAIVYRRLGRYLEAADLHEKILQLDLTNFGEKHSNVARSQSNLALVYSDLGRYKEAADLLEKALQWALANFGDMHLTATIVQSNLAIVYSKLGRYKEAADLHKKTLQLDLTNFGKKHPSVARSQSNLALVYSDLGRFNEAAELLEKALQSDLTNFGSKHPNVTIKQSNLASVYRYLGRYEEAAELLEKALQSDLTNFGSKHPIVAVQLSNLAIVYSDLGRYEEAAELLEKALQSNQTNFGDLHPTVTGSQSNLAIVYSDLGRYKEALDLLEKVLQSDLTNFGERHPNVARSLSNLATVYKDLGRFEQASELLEKVLQSDRTNFGDKHPTVAVSQSNLANVYRDLGRYEEAADLLEKALQSDLNNFGDKHPTVAVRQWNLAAVYQKQNKNDEAYNLLEKAYSTFLNHLGEQHPDTNGVKSYLDAYKK